MSSRMDIDRRLRLIESALPSVRRQTVLDILSLVLIVLLGGVAVLGTLSTALDHRAVAVAAFGVFVVAFAGLYDRMVSRTDHVRALQSDRMIKIANESLSYLRLGLDTETAGEVCRIVLKATEAAAVAITDRTQVLGFAGIGEEHHLVGGPIITRATQEAIDFDEPRIVHSKADIGCPEPSCRLRAAVVVPLEQREQAVGTLKFYYTSDRYLSETQLAMAEGLARLLSTQLMLAELERQTELATEMELKALQAQINPHFLFNTINTISSFIRTDPAQARQLLRQFASFYRRTLEQAEGPMTLDQELEYVETYVELEKARFGDRLDVRLLIEPDIRDHPMPAFMIQPLVENSVAHGMRPDGSPLTVSVVAARCAEGVCVQVSDDGVGIPADKLAHLFEHGVGKGLGIALRNVRDRLRGHFGPESLLRIESTPNVGTTVSLVIPALPSDG